jgi:hypothetical protein
MLTKGQAEMLTKGQAEMLTKGQAEMLTKEQAEVITKDLETGGCLPRTRWSCLLKAGPV